MKKTVLIALFQTILLIRCNHHETKKNTKDSYDSLKQQIIGKWGGNDRVPGLYICTNSVYEISWKDSCPYFFIKDTFFVKFPDRNTATLFGKMSVNGDTLTWVDREGIKTFAYRCK